jgi:hypothetical protein
MRYAKVENGVVVQTQPYSEAGFIECPDNIVAGYLHDGTNFTAPPPAPKTWEDVRAKQRQLIESVRAFVEIHMTQRDLGMADADMKVTAAKYAEFLQYLQDVRDNDETLHPDPDTALAALDSLVVPTVP